MAHICSSGWLGPSPPQWIGSSVRPVILRLTLNLCVQINGWKTNKTDALVVHTLWSLASSSSSVSPQDNNHLAIITTTALTQGQVEQETEQSTIVLHMTECTARSFARWSFQWDSSTEKLWIVQWEDGTQCDNLKLSHAAALRLPLLDAFYSAIHRIIPERVIWL